MSNRYAVVNDSPEPGRDKLPVCHYSAARRLGFHSSLFTHHWSCWFDRIMSRGQFQDRVKGYLWGGVNAHAGVHPELHRPRLVVAPVHQRGPDVLESWLEPGDDRFDDSADLLALLGAEGVQGIQGRQPVSDDGIMDFLEFLRQSSMSLARVQQVLQVALHRLDHLLDAVAAPPGGPARARIDQPIDDRRHQTLLFFFGWHGRHPILAHSCAALTDKSSRIPLAQSNQFHDEPLEGDGFGARSVEISTRSKWRLSA